MWGSRLLVLSWCSIQLLWLHSQQSEIFREPMPLFRGHLLCLLVIERAWLEDMDVLRGERLGGESASL
jgi:hypothetical protein